MNKHTNDDPKGDNNDLFRLAVRLRQHVLRMTNKAQASHIGSNYSAVELIAVLYKRILKYNPELPNWPDRDRFILSKGHSCAVLYAALAECGFFPTDWLNTFCQNGSNLLGHISHTSVPGVEVSTGSLGHGLPIAAGMALAAKLDGKPYRIFTLLGDGECDEGSIWEAALFAPQYRLDNLVIIIDYNKIQSLGFTKDILDLEPLADKWRAFGWNVQEIDGHNLQEIQDVLAKTPQVIGAPTCIIAHTIKGKGVSFMENKLLWHYRYPRGEEFEAALQELEDTL